jgi:hypothetical protein
VTEAAVQEDHWRASAVRRVPDSRPVVVDEAFSTCGVRTFARGELESLGGTFHAVHVPTLDLTPEQFAAIPVRYVNGRDGRYDQVPEHPDAI